MKQQWKTWQKALLVVALIAAAYFWYTRPMTLAQICPSFRWAQVTHVGGLEHVGDISAPAPAVSSENLPVNDPEAQVIYQQFLTARFRRDPLTALTNLLSGWSTYTFGEAGGFPELTFFAPDPDQRIDLIMTEDKTAALHSADIDLPLRYSDKALFWDALNYLRAHPFDNTPKLAA